MKKKWYYRILSLALVISMLSWLTNFTVYAIETNNNIRVGLTQFYEQKQTLKIKTAKIGIGYSVNDTYYYQNSFTSTTGYLFQPETGSFYVSANQYSSYEEAQKAAKQFRKLGVACYPVFYQMNLVKLYVGPTENQTINQVKTLMEDKFGISLERLTDDNGHRVLVTGSNDVFIIDGEGTNGYPQIRANELNDKKIVAVDLGARQYRGRIEIGRYGQDTLTAVNIVDMNNYLYSVVACEMVSSWPMESLKAQAVCSRSYACVKTGFECDSNNYKPYKLSDTTKDQVYKGCMAETERARNAVLQTMDEVVTYDGKIIMSYYFSTSGGKTEDSLLVWGNSSNYLKSVSDHYETSPELEPWILSMSKQEIKTKLGNAGYDIGGVVSIVPEIYTSSGRVYVLKINGTTDTLRLQSEEIRTIFDLYSTKFDILSYGSKPNEVTVLSENGKSIKNLEDCYVINSDVSCTKLSAISTKSYIVKSGDNQKAYSKAAPLSSSIVYFVGMGYGHGVGMSQSGAKGMAEAGFDYRQIVQYYYTGSKVRKND